jgi:AraC family transcriptional regulator
MDTTVQRAVERAIATMRDNLGEQLTIDDLARAALFSKFHFSRVFQQATGVSPGRFLSAMRLAEAQRLLLSTTITIADISHRVGYSSVGTFSTRFSARVGVSPTTYRRRRGSTPRIPAGGPGGGGGTDVCGRVVAPPGLEPGLVFVGLFTGRIPEGTPVRYTVLDGPGQYLLPNVPEGTWHLTAHHITTPTSPAFTPGADLYTAHNGPLTTEPGVLARLADLRLRPKRSFDPPMLLALPDLRTARVPALAA